MIREYRDTTEALFFFFAIRLRKFFVHLRLVNLVLFTMRNGSIVLGESTLNLVLPRLTKENPIIFFCYILQPSSRKS